MAALADEQDYTAVIGASVRDPYLLDVDSAAVRGYCGWHINSVTASELVLDANGGWLLRLPCLRVTDVAEVTVDDEPITDYEWSAVGLLRRTAGWPVGYRRVGVTYSGGYDPVPDEIVAAVCSVANRSPAAGVSSMTVGGQTVSYSADAGPGLTATEKMALARHRIPTGS